MYVICILKFIICCYTLQYLNTKSPPNCNMLDCIYVYLTYIVTGTLYYRWIPNLCLLNGSIMKSWPTQISIAEIYEQITLWTDLLRSYTTFAIMQFIMFLLRKQVNSVCVCLFYLGPDHLCQLQKIAACYFLLFIYGLLFQKIVNFFAYFPK